MVAHLGIAIKRDWAAALASILAVCAPAIAACGGAIAPEDAGGDASSFDASARADAADASDCPDTGDAPASLACTGLYADFARKEIAADVRPYAPAVPLWSDGAEKARFIALPEGQPIDISSPSEWKFPIGTRVWKEFRVGAKRVETRYFVKLRATYWAHATYVWTDDESAAARSFGADLGSILLGGKPYHVPKPTECDQCHKGRDDRLLGFEAVSLGLPGASGLTLAALAAEGRLVPAPARVSLRIGDDGTGADGPALAWLHVNCGVTCHNGNSSAIGYGTGMRLRLDPAQLDGRAASSWDALATTEGVPARTPAWSGQLRIAPGEPSASLLVKLIGTRTSDAQNQMPPLASHVVDDADVAAVTRWIARMPPPSRDAGADASAPVDASTDADATGDAGAASDADAADVDAAADAAMDGGADAE